MIKVDLIDDEQLTRRIVRGYLQTYNNIEVLQECNDGFEGIKAMQQLKPHLILLDIQMQKMNGFEMLEILEERPGATFTNYFDDYADKALETYAADYLLKPSTKKRFVKTMEKCLLPIRNSSDDPSETLMKNLQV